MPAGRASTIWGGGKAGFQGLQLECSWRGKACPLLARSPAISLGFRLGEGGALRDQASSVLPPLTLPGTEFGF